ncbi:phosphate signaling complex protein PhoU [Cryptosporangium phraense]|uniref:Phosphate-specific transport system accessory protein PhoU n=1 Tax=Cryptosporangium phraense TaxID=2593070 RepID=A0A545AEQ1_9ACTN|nr:phosphate signaling complex protein PhoU [Cryptosporangium phraense]TQS39804.1 phosphate signaling complex protein PhoU [Cryptosporangium phraense]
MRVTFHRELSSIADVLITMTGLADSAMYSATRALLTADLALADSVIAADAHIDVLHHDLEERCLRVLALHHPVAIDLRTVLASLRIVSALERMGDLARHIATIARMRYPDRAVPADLEPTFVDAGRIANALTQRVAALLADHDITTVDELTAIDDQMDELHRSVFTTLLHEDWPHGMVAAIDVVLLSRFYERYADHAVSLSRRIVEQVTGNLPDRARSSG